MTKNNVAPFFATIPKGFDKQKYQVDPYLLASKLASDAILSHHTTAFAKVGFFLEQHKTALKVDEAFLQKLEQHQPKSQHLIQRQNRKDGTLLNR